MTEEFTKEEKKRFTIAFSPLFQVYIAITHVYEDKEGELMFVGKNTKAGIKDHLFREQELTDFMF